MSKRMSDVEAADFYAEPANRTFDPNRVIRPRALGDHPRPLSHRDANFVHGTLRTQPHPAGTTDSGQVGFSADTRTLSRPPG